MKPQLMAALLAAGSTVQAAEPASEDLRALIEIQQQQIELLQDQLDATKASLAK